MKVAAGREFFERYHDRAHAIVPDLNWALIEPDGSWSEPPGDCDLIVYAGDAYREQFVEAMIALPHPRWAHTEDAGTDGLFYDAMRAKKVTITHSPGANAPEVAEFAIGLVLWSAKRFGTFQRHQDQHRWEWINLESLSDKTLLVVGLGAIGSLVAAHAKGFQMRVLGIRESSLKVPKVDRQGSVADLPEFLGLADFVVLALPSTPATQGLIGKRELAQMKSTATLINVARGSIVDIQALKEALESGEIHQACLDVISVEPWPKRDPLWDMPNLFLTPHNAWSSPLYLPRVAELWLNNLERYARGEELLQQCE
ncbi:MAG: D-2-hydroxyacid dehydrogenase [Myxococcales bacterium]|nr:D-2-hydroxyacid dehydrogenase [Myxococcales bacterium]